MYVKERGRKKKRDPLKTAAKKTAARGQD